MKAKQDSDQPVVLIVDDQPSNIHALAKLIKEDYQIQVANSGAKALQIATGQHQPDLILLDIMMPEMDGYLVCRKLKDNPQTKDIPVIFVTALHGSEDEEQGFNLGAADYISRPFQPAIVRARVRNQVNLKLKTDMLEKLAMRDGLTDIPNRRFYEQRSQEEFSRAVRNRHPLSVLMMDIDNFKAYNDHYGHGAGDDCLRRVAKALRDALARPMDLVARYGGEEFVVLLPETDAQGALHVGERLRAAVEAQAIAHEYSDVAGVVTLSIGAATSKGEGQASMQDLQQAADQALYRAKDLGRNQVQSEQA
ncbi:MAG: diguanylate cyclase [Desulfohalobiaceae bacterium]